MTGMGLYFGSFYILSAAYNKTQFVLMIALPIGVILFSVWVFRNGFRWPCSIRDSSNCARALYCKGVFYPLNTGCRLHIINDIEIIYIRRSSHEGFKQFHSVKSAIWVRATKGNKHCDALLEFADSLDDALSKADSWMDVLGTESVKLDTPGFPQSYRFSVLRKWNMAIIL